MTITVVSVVGARPQFVKAAVVSRALAARDVAERIVHTGQHYDRALSAVFLSQLGLAINENLRVGPGSHAVQTGRIMTGFAGYLAQSPPRPDAIIVYGDTTSTLAAALVASQSGIPLIHVEAGLRSFDRSMPEEVNRVVTDHLSSLLLCPSSVGVENLRREGIDANAIDVGDVMLDALRMFRDAAPQSDVTEPFVLATFHRPSNTDDPDRLRAIIRALGESDRRVIWPVHPRARVVLSTLAIPATVSLVEPVGYLEMLALLRDCSAVITDSGGLQKEAHWMRKPCITVRAQTEWTETLEGGWNTLADPFRDDFAQLLAREQTSPWRLLYGDGCAADRIAHEIVAFCRARA